MQPSMFIAIFIKAEEARMKCTIKNIRQVFGPEPHIHLIQNDFNLQTLFERDEHCHISTCLNDMYRLCDWQEHLQKLLRPIAQCQTYAVKFDADTLFLRKFEVAPTAEITGSLQYNTYVGMCSVQGGCVTITAEAAKKMLICLHKQPDDVWDRYLSVVGHDGVLMETFKRGRLTNDWLLGALADVADVNRENNMEISSHWKKAPDESAILTAAAVHPNRSIEFMRAYAEDLGIASRSK